MLKYFLPVRPNFVRLKSAIFDGLFNTVAMNVRLPKSCVSALTLGVLFLLSSATRLPGQSGSPYKSLFTVTNTIVSDTISGLNLDINKISPLAQHGDVNLLIINSGGGSNPYVYEIRYTPDPGFIGVDTFTLEFQYIGNFPYLIYRAYQVTVLPSLIQSGNDYAVTTNGMPVTINVLANDSGTNGPFTLSSIPLVDNGTASIVGPGQIEFTPESGFSGVAHLNYVLCDAIGHCQTEQVEIGVHDNNPPAGDTLQVATTKNTLLRIPLTYNGFTTFQAPANGVMQIPNGQTFEYKPNPNFTGTDQFVLVNNQFDQPFYKTVRVRVLDVQGQNYMAIDDYVYTPVGKPITFNVRSNDIGNLTVKNWSIPANLPGTVSGTSSSGNVTFTPNPNYTGVATFYYKIGNMFVPDLEIAAVRVIIGNQNPQQATYNFSTPAETPFVINYKIPFTGFSFNLPDPPDHGACDFYPGFSTHLINGQTVSGNNLLIYTPEAGFTGTDEFEINYCVAANGQCKDVKISMSVTDIYTTTAPYCVDDCVWAGDLNNDGIVNNKDLLPLGYAMGVDGMVRDNASLEWYGQYSDNWNNPFSGMPFDLKHADTDGNGLITAEDTLAISLFYNQTHALTPVSPTTGKGLPFFLHVLTQNPHVGDLVQVEVDLGDSNFPVANLYGFTFDVSLSSNLVDSGLTMRYYDNIWPSRNSPSLWMAKTPTNNRLETAYTRTNGEPASGFGPVGEFEFIIIDIVHGGKPQGKDQESASVLLHAPQIMWADGHTTTGADYTLEIPLDRSQDADLPATDQDFIVYPSPASDRVQVHLNGNDWMERISLTDMTGRVVFQTGNGHWDHFEIPVDKFPSGIYGVSAYTSSGVHTRKIQVLPK